MVYSIQFGPFSLLQSIGSTSIQFGLYVKVQNVYKTSLNVYTPNLQITNSNLISNNVCAENEYNLITELINNLNQIKSHPQ